MTTNPKIQIHKVQGRYVFVTPYNKGYVEAIKKVAGRRYNPEQKAWSVPLDKKAEAYEILKLFFGGQEAMGEKGLFRIPPTLYVQMSDAEKARVDEQEAAKEARKAEKAARKAEKVETAEKPEAPQS